MKATFILLVLAFTVVEVSRGEPASDEMIGCITQAPNGGFELQSRPSGAVFPIQEGTVAAQYLNELVRVRSEIHPLGNGGKNRNSLRIEQIELVNQSCASVGPAQRAIGVGGKVGEGQMAVPITSSRSADQTTPGFQTENIVTQQPPGNGRVVPIDKPRSLYSPGNIAQVTKTAASAEAQAVSATQTEIIPGSTLGVDTMPGNSSAAEARSKTKIVRPR